MYVKLADGKEKCNVVWHTKKRAVCETSEKVDVELADDVVDHDDHYESRNGMDCPVRAIVHIGLPAKIISETTLKPDQRRTLHHLGSQRMCAE